MLSINSPVYDGLLILHVVAGILGYGAIAFSGVFARRVISEGTNESTRRYFDGKVNIPGQFVGLVPILGVILLVVGTGNIAFISKAWFLVALAIWILTAGMSYSLIFPNEKRLAVSMRQRTPDVGSLAKTIEKLSAVCSVLYVVAFYMMLFKPTL